mmetsp:Transcript_100664/g.189809  ORF Transcript_100664/g.189809 Transcript_100664/m.189809 type:complete len:281 (+) Transcript_100664:62-904(+)
MRAIALVLACVVCEGHGLGVDKASGRMQEHLGTAVSTASQPSELQRSWPVRASHPLRKLATLLLASNRFEPGAQRLLPAPRRHHPLLSLRGGETTLKYCGTMMDCVETLHTEEDLKVKLEEVRKGTVVIVVCFADWSAPCVEMAPLVDELAKKAERSSRVKFLKVDVDNAADLLAPKAVTSIPTLLFYRKGELVNRMDAEDLAASIESLNSESPVECIKTALEGAVGDATRNPLLGFLRQVISYAKPSMKKWMLTGFILYLVENFSSEPPLESRPWYDIE